MNASAMPFGAPQDDIYQVEAPDDVSLIRSRCHTWPQNKTSAADTTTAFLANQSIGDAAVFHDNLTECEWYNVIDYNSQDYLISSSQPKAKNLNSVKNKSRKNAWGDLSYAQLITKAIQSSSDGRMTLSEIYEWMVKNIQHFKDKGDTNSSAGWKNSIRHNLSLHSQFMRVQNEGSGKSSWWMINPNAEQEKHIRRRSCTLESKSIWSKKKNKIKRASKKDLAELRAGGKNAPMNAPDSYTHTFYKSNSMDAGITLSPAFDKATTLLEPVTSSIGSLSNVFKSKTFLYDHPEESSPLKEDHRNDLPEFHQSVNFSNSSYHNPSILPLTQMLSAMPPPETFFNTSLKSFDQRDYSSQGNPFFQEKILTAPNFISISDFSNRALFESNRPVNNTDEDTASRKESKFSSPNFEAKRDDEFWSDVNGARQKLSFFESFVNGSLGSGSIKENAISDTTASHGHDVPLEAFSTHHPPITSFALENFDVCGASRDLDCDIYEIMKHDMSVHGNLDVYSYPALILDDN